MQKTRKYIILTRNDLNDPQTSLTYIYYSGIHFNGSYGFEIIIIICYKHTVT